MNSHDELRDLWCGQPPASEKKGEDMLAMVQRRMQRFDRTVAARNWRESIAGGIVILFFGWCALITHDELMRAGYFVIVAGSAWMIYCLLRFGRSGPSGEELNQDSGSYTRALLERYDRQIRLLKSVLYWYLLPVYVGLLITTSALIREHIRKGTFSWADFLAPVIYSTFFACVWWLNAVYAARRLERERAKLLAMTGDEMPIQEEK